MDKARRCTCWPKPDDARPCPPHDAHRQLDETSMQVFWRTWPGISSWTGSLWRLLNEELMDPANSSTDLDADEVGGSG